MEVCADKEEGGSPQCGLACGGAAPLLTGTFDEQGVVDRGHECPQSCREGNYTCFLTLVRLKLYFAFFPPCSGRRGKLDILTENGRRKKSLPLKMEFLYMVQNSERYVTK